MQLLLAYYYIIEQTAVNEASWDSSSWRQLHSRIIYLFVEGNNWLELTEIGGSGCDLWHVRDNASCDNISNKRNWNTDMTWYNDNEERQCTNITNADSIWLIHCCQINLKIFIRFVYLEIDVPRKTAFYFKEKEMQQRLSSSVHCGECTLVTNKRAACRKIFCRYNKNGQRFRF